MDRTLVVAKYSSHPLATDSPCTYAHTGAQLWRRDEKENSFQICMGRDMLNVSCRKSSKCYHSLSLQLNFSPVLTVKYTIKCWQCCLSKYHTGVQETSVMSVRKPHILSVTCPPTCKMVLGTTKSFSMSVKSLMFLSTMPASERAPFTVPE